MTVDDLTLEVGGAAISGWTDIEVTLGIERCPSDFRVQLTERFPGEAKTVEVKPGDPCKVKLGNDLVITGYVDAYEPSIDSRHHQIEVSGRGKCQDLVDCSADWPGGQVINTTALDLATKLAGKYGVKVAADNSDIGGKIPQFNIMVGETPYEIIERIGAWRGFLAYELADGSLYLATAGAKKMASGFKLGGDDANVLAAKATYSIAQRYQSYRGFLQAIDTLEDLKKDPGKPDVNPVIDKGVPRFRQLDLVVEAQDTLEMIATRRVTWEATRRAGRGMQLEITADSWRDKDGQLWLPNAIVPVDMPALKAPSLDWTISEVKFRRGENGTSAEVVVMPKDAFVPEPHLLNPINPDLVQGQTAKR
jgi:prophage tail gpP-like protein